MEAVLPRPGPPPPDPSEALGSSPEKGLLGASVSQNLLVWGRQGQACCPPVRLCTTHYLSSAGGSVMVPETRSLKAPEMGVTLDSPGAQHPHKVLKSRELSPLEAEGE